MEIIEIINERDKQKNTSFKKMNIGYDLGNWIWEKAQLDG